uniref:G2/mitotic-specific cyclin-B3-like n=1 Tax=Sinocyclocheilus grahami TaxID=75366 RepID=A0A672RUM2_SINGR
KMPFSRGKNPNTSKIPKLHPKGLENQQDGPQTKRSSSSPQGAPKKRTAFVDITNVRVPFTFLFIRVFVQTCTTVLLLSCCLTRRDLKHTKNFIISYVFQIPPEYDIDSEHLSDSVHAVEYAKDIFDYLKSREEKFVLHDYMADEQNLNSNMRAILVDWLVEVQENFELNHETLYLAVKMTDHYLAVSQARRESLQLIGSTAMLIASKFEERAPPCVDDFLYICDDAYKRSQLIAMEISILQALNFDINIPVPYRFLRRYAKCVNAGMDTLTLARFICELSLLEMDFVPVRASLLASACLLIALVTKDLGGWTQCLQFHSGYSVEDLAPVVRKLHDMLIGPPDSKLAVIRSKYAHKVFFEVALIPTVSLETLEGFLK